MDFDHAINAPAGRLLITPSAEEGHPNQDYNMSPAACPASAGAGVGVEKTRRSSC